jgi:hypothetical protein
MLRGINSRSKYLQVNSGTSSTYVNNYGGSVGVGNMRYNTSTQTMEVYDGTTWIMLNMSYADVNLSGEAESLLDWVQKKRDEEFRRQVLAESNPAIKDLVEQIKEKEDQIKMIQTLMQKEVTD